MKISVINHFNSVDEAWKVSRQVAESTNDYKVENVRGLDLPVNEFSVFHLVVESTLIEREIFATVRNHRMWARSSRVDDVLQFKLPLSVEPEDRKIYEEMRQVMEHDSKTTRQDDYRLGLPVMALTTYNLIISARDLIKVAKYMEYLSSDDVTSNQKVGFLFFYAHEKLKSFLHLYNYDNYAMANYKFPKILNENRVSPGIRRNNNFTTITANLDFNMRAQLARHRFVLFHDDMFLNILNNEQGHLANMRTPINVAICGDDSALKEIATKRSCWVAQYNTWSPLINQITEIFGDASLPCADGVCPFLKENESRYLGLDPNAPCPRALNLQGLQATQEHIVKMEKQMIDDNRPAYWSDEIDQLEIK